MKRKIILGILTVLALAGTFVAGEKVFAETNYDSWIGENTGTGGGGGGGGGGCNDDSNRYRIDCAGASWTFYYATEAAVGKNIPFGGLYTYLVNSTGTQAVIPSTCAEHIDQKGGFWHYGVNGIGASNGNFAQAPGASGNFYIQPGNWGHWQTLSYGVYDWVPEAVKSIDHSIMFGGELAYWSNGSSYTSSDPEVVSAYQNAYKIKLMKDGMSESDAKARAKEISGIPVGTWGFCAWDFNIGYTGQSAVVARRADNNVAASATTEIQMEIGSTPTSTNPVNVNVNDEITIEFLHNPYSASSASNIFQGVTSRSGLSGNTQYYTITSRQTAGDCSGNVNMTTQDGIRYTVGSRPYQDDKGNSFSCKETYKIKFIKATATPVSFCEIYSVEANNKNKTWVCTSVTVTSGDYRGWSGVYNGETGDYVTTGLLKTPSSSTPRISAALDLKNGKATDTIVFTHNAYTTTPLSRLYWKVERNFSLSGAGYTINRKGGMLNNQYSSSSLSVSTEYPSGFYRLTTNYTDNHGDSYLMRNEYEITFTRSGTYTFCEKIYLGSSASALTQTTEVCKEITVGGTIGGTCESANWMPASYRNSANGSTGQTSVLSAVSNGRSDGSTAGWNGIVSTGESRLGNIVGGIGLTYARPWDTVTWTNCYYPGVQYFNTKQVLSINQKGNYVGTHAQERGCGCTSNTYVSFESGVKKVGGSWTNLFDIDTTSPAGINGSFNYSSGPLASGLYQVRSISNSYLVRSWSVGEHYQDKIYTAATPIRVWMSDGGTHSWTASCCSSSECGTHSCSCGKGCVTTCCNTCTVTRHHCNSEVIGNYTANTSTPSSTAEVQIPYNFNNSVSVQLNSVTSGAELVYAGERANISNASVTVGCRSNSTVGGAVSGCVEGSGYATIVRNAKIQMVAYVSSSPSGGYVGTNGSSDICSKVSAVDGQCTTINEMSGDLNGSNSRSSLYGTRLSGSNLSGSNGNFNDSYNVFDARAGNYFCVVIGVYPASSGSDTNWQDAEGNHQWAISSPSCKVIAKKPTFEVWGGDLFTNGAIKVSTMVKQNFFGVTGYTPKNTNNATVLGSWVDHGIIANGLVNALASGASLGKSSSPIGEGNREAGVASGTANFCNYRVPLSFANYGKKATLLDTQTSICPGSATSIGGAGISTSTVDRAAMVSYWMPATDTGVNVGGASSLNTWTGAEIRSATGRTIRYYHAPNGFTINASNIGLRQTYVVKVDGTLNINGDIRYSTEMIRAANGDLAGQIPKVVIYATGDIKIGCNVTELDAMLIAGGNVNTCREYESSNTPAAGAAAAGTRSGVNAPERQNRLFVRGVIVANTITLSRTYGAGMGYDSTKAAEIIDYDTSSVLWGRYMAGAAESDTMTVTYQHELAPRY